MITDVFLNDDYGDDSEECNENIIDISGLFNETSDMTLVEQDASESELFASDDMLVNPDDLLPHVAKLEKYANSNIAFNRQVVARNLLETLRLVHDNNDDVARVINVLNSISEDYDPSVRTELMVQLPHIAAFCKEVKLNNIIAQYLVPMLLSYLREENNLVRKASHSALLAILEQGLVDFTTQTEKIWPLILHMTDSVNPEDTRTESILLMSKLLGLMGAEEQFFDRLFALCADRSNNIRKACASTFGDICTTVGRELTEEVLLPKFFTLCEDSAWCVRKACAENFMPVSCIVSREIRCKELSSLYMILLSDQSRWVRVTAYQALGPFISTFAEPDKTGLYYSKDGILTIVPSVVKASDQKLKCSDVDSNCDGDCSKSTSKDFQLSFDFTNSSETCDNVVPLNCVVTSSSSVPNISCQVGSYCTVIEVSSPTSTTNLTDKSESDAGSSSNSDKNSSQNSELQSNVDSVTETDCHSTNNNTLGFDSNVNGLENEIGNDILHQSEEEFMKLWYEAAYGCNDISSGDLCHKGLNGDIDAVNNKLNLITKRLESLSVSERHFKNSITVNGMSFCKSIPLPESNNLGVLSVSCADSNSNPNTSTDCVLNVSSKDLRALHNELHSTTTGEENVQCNSSTENKPSQNSNCTECKESEKTGERDMLKSSSDTILDDESAFNHFQYWREEIPVIECDEEFRYYWNNCISALDTPVSTDSLKSYEKREIEKPKRKSQTSLETKSETKCESSDSEDSVEIHSGEADDIATLLMLKTNVKRCKAISKSENKGEPPPVSKQFTVHDQDIVPPELLLQYISMIDSSWAQTIDAEIARHCAYSLPAVALTLGRKYWPCLKETFDALTSDLQGFIMMWKVRRTVASAMHQLAVILGPDITSRDLLPVFSRFIRDLDEVRVGILQHLYDFLKILRPEERIQFLPCLPEFLISNSDSDNNEKNWRFRLILAEQLVCIADLYEPQHVRDHLVPLSLTLIKDKICEVRLSAVRVMAAVMKRMSQSPTPSLTKAVLIELTQKFVHSPKWLHRQLYVYVCQEFIVENSLSADQFAEDALPQLLYLCWDRVPNVRLAIARCLVTVIWPLEAFSSPDSSHRELLLETIHTLQSDIDADVRFYANMVSTHDCSCLQNGEFNNQSDNLC